MDKFKYAKAVEQLMSPEGRPVIVPAVEVFFNKVITSAHNINMDHSKLIVTDRDLSLKQVVVAAGVNACVKKGDWIEINPSSFPFEDIPGKNDVGTRRKVKPPLETIGSTEYFVFTDRSVSYRYLKEEV